LSSSFVSQCYSRPDYDPKLPLHGYSVALIGRLSKKPSILKKQIEQLDQTKADKTTVNNELDKVEIL